MEQQNSWVDFKDIQWSDSKFNRFHIDTRDFCVAYSFTKEDHKDWDSIQNQPGFLHSENELRELIERLYLESGGKGEWRCLNLDSSDKRVENWNLKYLRIFRTEKRFLVCNNLNQPLPKKLLKLPVEQKYLKFCE